MNQTCDAQAPGTAHIEWRVAKPGTSHAEDLSHGWFDSPLGPVLAIGGEAGLSALAFAAEHGREATFAAMAKRFAGAPLPARPEALRRDVEAALSGSAPVRARVAGSAFDIRVWQALLTIPPGRVASYGVLAQALGKPGGARAVGGAVGRNPLALVIPCHRVVAADGTPGGYRWGLSVKDALLARERGCAAPSAPAAIPAV